MSTKIIEIDFMDELFHPDDFYRNTYDLGIMRELYSLCNVQRALFVIHIFFCAGAGR